MAEAEALKVYKKAKENVETTYSKDTFFIRENSKLDIGAQEHYYKWATAGYDDRYSAIAKDINKKADRYIKEINEEQREKLVALMPGIKFLFDNLVQDSSINYPQLNVLSEFEYVPREEFNEERYQPINNPPAYNPEYKQENGFEYKADPNGYQTYRQQVLQRLQEIQQN